MKLITVNAIHDADLTAWARQHLKRTRKLGTTNGGCSQAIYYIYDDQYRDQLKGVRCCWINDRDLEAQE